MKDERRELLVLDVYALVYRAFFALPPLTSRSGEPVNAVYGFERMLNKMLMTEKPTHVAACFDSGIPAERLEAVPQYKANRPEMPEDLRPQFNGVRRVLEAYGIAVVECPGEEADDCIATLVTRASKDGISTSIISGDLDLLQLVDGNITVVVPKRGIADLVRYDPAAVRERFGIDPMQLPDFRGLKGDPSDNLPGVPGIGEKTASKLIAQYGTLDALLADPSGVTPKRIADLLVQHGDQARRCRDVSTAKRDLSIDVAWPQLEFAKPPPGRLAGLYASFGFNTLLERLGVAPDEAASPNGTVGETAHATVEGVDGDYRILETADEAAKAISTLFDGDAAIALVPADVAWRGPELVAIAFCRSAGEAFAVPASLVTENAAVRAAVAALLSSKSSRIFVHDAKSFAGWAASAGLQASNIAFDTSLAAGLLDPTVGEPTIAESSRMAGLSLPVFEQQRGPVAMEMFEGPPKLETAIAASADAILRAAPKLEAHLKEIGQESLLRDLELPLAAVLARVERIGLRLDVAEMDRIRADLDRMVADVSAQIFRIAGEEFNINSTKAVGSLLFEKLALPGGTRTKTGYATGSEVLAPLAVEHEIAARILEYRETAKLKSTYVDSLPTLVDPTTGLLHTTFHQLGAATGRLSSTNPNLQNIPVRTAAGRAIRRALLPPTPGNLLLAADYSQIELRLFAHLSKDRHLIDAFAAGQDVHAFTARAVFGVPDGASLDPDLRRRAKAVNFGILYGMGSFGLAQSAGISRAQAREFIAGYFARFPAIKQYIDSALERARERGFVTTLLGRRRYLPDLRSRNHAMRAAAERMAVNAPLQGSAADLIKLAMVGVARRLDAERFDARMVLQVHDELLFDVAPAQLDALRDLVREEMEGAMKLDVPIVVDFKSGPTWADVE